MCSSILLMREEWLVVFRKAGAEQTYGVHVQDKIIRGCINSAVIKSAVSGPAGAISSVMTLSSVSGSGAKVMSLEPDWDCTGPPPCKTGG